MTTTAPTMYAEVLVSDLTSPPMLAAVTWVEGYDTARKAWKVALADLPQRVPAGSPPDRTAWVQGVDTRWVYTIPNPEWRVIDANAPLPAEVSK